MAGRRPPYPIAEGLGILVGVLAWDLLAEGRVDFGKALAIAVGGSLLWYGVRHLMDR